VDEAVASRRFSPGTMVRAGDFLLRHDLTDAAVVAARDGVARCRGLLSAYVLGIRCAVEIRDEKWALACALNGVDSAVDPTPFYKTIVEIKSFDKSSDADMVAALEYLRERFPEETKWAERLAHIYFQKRDVGRALTVLGPAMAGDLGSVRLQSVVVAAEAARLDGDLACAVNILEAAYAMYPDRVSVLNNLVYYLAQEPETLPRARELLPALLDMGEESFAVLDTAAVVYMKSGQIDLAGEYMSRALKRVDEKSYGVSETRLNAAEILFRMGEYEKARDSLEAAMRSPDRSRDVDIGAQQLRERIEQQILER
jgi:tetratricopeptide (TPR) repeat protein